MTTLCHVVRVISRYFTDMLSVAGAPGHTSSSRSRMPGGWKELTPGL